jgi:hypothetical protein
MISTLSLAPTYSSCIMLWDELVINAFYPGQEGGFAVPYNFGWHNLVFKVIAGMSALLLGIRTGASVAKSTFNLRATGVVIG